MNQQDLITALEQAIEDLSLAKGQIVKSVKLDLQAVLRDLTKQEKAK